MNLPLLSSERPTAAELQSPEALAEVYKAIENMLFEIYEELQEGMLITGRVVLLKIAGILGLTDLPVRRQDLEEIDAAVRGR
jgi:hypothetical protein